jgi:hypothetical protein
MASTSTFVASDPQQIAFLLLKRLTSPSLVRHFIMAKAGDALPEELIERKAHGVASAVQSAVDYWMMPAPSLNLHIVSRYYALLQLTIAEQVAAPGGTDDLATVQGHTKYGHGLTTFQIDSGNFPDNFMINILKTGHFAKYFSFLGLSVQDYAIDGRPKNPRQEAVAQKQAASLSDLLRRVPELQSIVFQHLQHRPLSFRMCYDEKNALLKYEQRASRKLEAPKEEGPGSKTTFLTIAPEAADIDCAYLDGLDLGGIRNLEEYVEDGQGYIRGELLHETEYWHESIPLYQSSYSPTSYIVPAFGTIRDPFILHGIILYALSIVARYYPNLWYELTVGKYTHVRSLIEFYLSILDHTVPLLGVERVTGQEIRIAQPGTFNAPI